MATQTVPAAGKQEYLYDLAGRAITVLDAGGDWQRGEVFAGGLHLATYTNSTTYFNHADWLGTERVRTDVSGVAVETCTSLPFGDGLACSGSDVSPLHFTGQERDAGLYDSDPDHFWFRNYHSVTGRWLTPDPAGLAAVDLSDPQSWNRYAYVVNNPLNFIDPFGLKPYQVSGSVILGGCVIDYIYMMVDAGGDTWVPDPSSFTVTGVNCGSDGPRGRGTGLPATGGAAANNGTQGKCISRSSLPLSTRVTLRVLGWAAQRSGGVRAVGVGGAGAFSPPSLAGGGGSVQALWMADYLGQQGLYWSVSGGPTVGEKGFGAVGGVQYMTSTFHRDVTVQDVVNSSLSVGGGAGAGFGLGVDVNLQTGVFTETIGFGTGGFGGSPAGLNVASGFIPICHE